MAGVGKPVPVCRPQKTLAASTINSAIIGGGSGSNTAVTSLDGFLNFIHTGGTFSKDNPGSPISYTLKYVKDNSVAGTLLYSSYAVRTPVYQPVDGELTVKYTSESSSSGCNFNGLLYIASEDDQSPHYSSGWVNVWNTTANSGGVVNGNINASTVTTFKSDPNIASLNVSDLHILLTCNPGYATWGSGDYTTSTQVAAGQFILTIPLAGITQQGISGTWTWSGGTNPNTHSAETINLGYAVIPNFTLKTLDQLVAAVP